MGICDFHFTPLYGSENLTISFIFLVYLAFVYYIPENGRIFGRNI